MQGALAAIGTTIGEMGVASGGRPDGRGRVTPAPAAFTWHVEGTIDHEPEHDIPLQRSYRGPLQAVLLDWAGTTMDFGCVAPAVVFVEVFRRQGVPISHGGGARPHGRPQARAYPEDHRARVPSAGAGRRRTTACPTTTTSSHVQAFVPLQLECLSDYSELIPGALETVATLRERGIKIGSTTGYTPR